MLIDLPYPHKALWPNGRYNRQGTAREIKKHRAWAHNATIAEVKGSVPERVVLRVTVYPKRIGPAPDRDNCIAACKAYFDGIADALKLNDRTFGTPEVTISESRSDRFTIQIGAAS